MPKSNQTATLSDVTIQVHITKTHVMWMALNGKWTAFYTALF